MAEYERIIKNNRIYYKRAKGVGIFTADDCYAWRVTGPPLRSAGVARDLRKDEPYAAYGEVDFEVAVEYNADVYDRFLVRMKEIRESCKIIRQCLDQMPDGDFIARDAAHTLPRKKDVLRESGGDDPGLQPGVPGAAGAQGRGLPGHRGAQGRDGRLHPLRGRAQARAACTSPPRASTTAQAVPPLVEGEMIADMVAIFASIDVVLGDCDR